MAVVVGRPTIGRRAAGKHAVVLHRATALNSPGSPKIEGKGTQRFEATGPLLVVTVVPLGLAAPT